VFKELWFQVMVASLVMNRFLKNIDKPATKQKK